ncbi:CBL-interacting serine/threonine-protein kinase 12-like [Hibiscus syriacus]|uniref:CBL-interacting serine/threonine-protein kinase 12-like n=1 Tax=Hibiscus syriacus TaxID=106335 RepID=A0A6A3AT54_HIBSY|nr:CBL-interacting serine/threonine-protein kinase 12-like [Hibiscus syriacus]
MPHVKWVLKDGLHDRLLRLVVTEPVAVPFVWEQIPGKAKGGPQHEFQPEASVIPELPPGRVSHVIKYPGERESRNQYVLRPQHSMHDNVSGLQCLNDGMNEKCILELEDENDVYSDALDTLFPTKPSMAPDHPGEVTEVASGEWEPLVNKYDSFIIPRSGILSRTIRGLLPRLCFMNSVCLFIPITRLKVRTRSSISSNCEVAKPGKTTSIKSGNRIVEKNGWDVCNNKSDSTVQSLRLPENKSDNEAQMRRLLEDKSDSGVESYRLPEIGEKVSCRSSQFSSANDLQMVTWLPPKRPTSNARIPPYRRERPQSPFSGEGFLGMPKQAEKFKANMIFSSRHTRRDLLDRKGIAENEITGSMKSSCSDKPYLRVQADQGESKGGSDYAPLPPPLPKSPSESWLSHALPAVTSRNSFSKSFNGTRFNTKKQEPMIPATGTKWETVVKSSYMHHHHHYVRYSEQAKTSRRNNTNYGKLLGEVRQQLPGVYQQESQTSRQDISALFSPSWNTALENSMLWIAGCRPSIYIQLTYALSGSQVEFQLDEIIQGLVRESLGQISATQLRMINDLHLKTIKEERKLSSQLASLQENIADQPIAMVAKRLSHVGEPSREVDRALDELDVSMSNILQEADKLRLSTLKELLGILTPLQGVDFSRRVRSFTFACMSGPNVLLLPICTW